MRREPAALCPPDTARADLFAHGTVTVRGQSGSLPIQVEVAATPDAREKGLMFRTSMPDTHGMLFIFDNDAVRHFWMKNTCISLDMVFVDSRGVIVGIEENTRVLDEGTYAVPCPSRYVLEVRGGWCREHGVKPGQTVEMEIGRQ